MAGDWMKVRLSLDRDPATQRIACACGVSLSTTVGALVRFWAWANENTATGRIEGLDLGWLDTLVSVPGFGAAMVSVGWLQVVDGQGLTIPKWASHNGENAKRRAQESARKNRVRKMSASCPQNVRMTAGQSADKMRPREEKRREEKTQPEEEALAWSAEFGWRGVSEADREAWAVAFPACNLDSQLARAAEWLRSNPDKARKKNWRRFLVNWLSRGQERGGDVRSAPIAGRFIDFEAQRRQAEEERKAQDRKKIHDMVQRTIGNG